MSPQATGWMASLYVPTARLQQTQQMQQHTIQKSKSTQLISWFQSLSTAVMVLQNDSSEIA